MNSSIENFVRNSSYIIFVLIFYNGFEINKIFKQKFLRLKHFLDNSLLCTCFGKNQIYKYQEKYWKVHMSQKIFLLLTLCQQKRVIDVPRIFLSRPRGWFFYKFPKQKKKEVCWIIVKATLRGDIITTSTALRWPKRTWKVEKNHCIQFILKLLAWLSTSLFSI